jgi:hypothetical protein
MRRGTIKHQAGIEPNGTKGLVEYPAGLVVYKDIGGCGTKGDEGTA